MDIVVNNAAYYPHAELEELSLDAWQRTITVNAVLPAITNGRHGGDARRR